MLKLMGASPFVMEEFVMDPKLNSDLDFFERCKISQILNHLSFIKISTQELSSTLKTAKSS